MAEGVVARSQSDCLPRPARNLTLADHWLGSWRCKTTTTAGVPMDSILGDADVVAVIARYVGDEGLLVLLVAQRLQHLEHLRRDVIRDCQEWRWHLAQQMDEAGPPEWWETDSYDSTGPPDWW